MNTGDIERALDELGLPLPATVVRARAVWARLGEVDVVVDEELSRKLLADEVRGRIAAGEDVDVVEVVRANRARGDTPEAAAVLRQAQDDAETLVAQAVESSSGQILESARGAILELLAQVRALPAGTPTTSDDAVELGGQAAEGYKALKALSARWAKLRLLHLNVLTGHRLTSKDVDPQAYQIFGDCRARPSLGGRVERAGPVEAIARLRWLATPAAGAWVPSARECGDFYFEWLRERQAPKAASPAPAAAARGRS